MGLHTFHGVERFGKLDEVLSCHFGKRLQLRIRLGEPGNEQMESDPEALHGTWSRIEATNCKVTDDDRLHARSKHFARCGWTRYPWECSGLPPMGENDLELENPAFVVVQLPMSTLG